MFHDYVNFGTLPQEAYRLPHLVYGVNVVHYAVWQDAFGPTAATKDVRAVAGVRLATRHGVDRTESRRLAKPAEG